MKWFLIINAFLLLDIVAYFNVPFDVRTATRWNILPGSGYVLLLGNSLKCAR